MKRPLLVFTHGGGRLGNQLINFAHIYSFWKEHSKELDIINMAFWPFYNLFTGTSSNPVCLLSEFENFYPGYYLLNRSFNDLFDKNRRSLNPFIRFIHLNYHVWPSAQSIMKGETPNYLKYLTGKLMQDFNFDSEVSRTMLMNKRRTALAGWPVRCWDLFEKHQDSVRNYFRFENPYRAVSEEYINGLRSRYDKVIGIFIRQGDYKIWYDGMYFFDIEFYNSIMNDIAEQYHANSKVCFVIASDDVQNMDEFKNHDVYFSTGSKSMGGHFAESLAELSLCDLIVSPPSTFGVLASFLGNVPLLPLYDKNQHFNEYNIIRNSIFDAIQHEHLSRSVK